MQHSATLSGAAHTPEVALARRLRAILGFSPRTASAVLLVCAGYYLGSQIGFVFRFPPATPSVLWPPNAILTAALLLTSPRRWGLYLLAALPAHLLAQSGTSWPMSMVLALFLTNCSEALVGAVVVRSLSDAPARFDTLRRVVAFLVGAVVLGPFLSSFLDAAVVAGFRGEPYWVVWMTRFPSNVLTELALVPAIVIVVRQRTDWIRAASPRRRWEAALLVLALLAVATVVFTAGGGAPGTVQVSHRAPIAFLLPLLVWAAVRFGPGGASLSLLATALVAIWAATQGLGLFGALPPREGVLALQIFLTVTATPLLCLAALIEEGRATELALSERLRFEELLSRLSGAFVQPPSYEMKAAFQTWLQRLGQFLAVDRVLLLEPAAEGDDLLIACSWVAPDLPAVGSALPAHDYPWLTEQLRAGRACAFSGLAALAGQAPRDRASFEKDAVGSVLAMPLLAGGRVLGALAFLAGRERPWPPGLWPQLRVVTEVLANALARKQSEEALRGSEVEARRSREELAHVLRVSTVGELGTSLAHELNQPLTAILANAQAAQHLLRGSLPDLEEVREILADMIEEDKRAGEVIRRLRELLKKGQRESVVLDLNTLVEGVAQMMSSDALIRGVAVRLELDAEPLMVSADRVQVQQVLLNLTLNAMEAMMESGAERTLVLRSIRNSAGAAEVEVQDTGQGVREGLPDRVFQPFYTTKPTGMGMGLSIARSIADAHGGRIWAANNPAGGATFHFTLPLTGD